MTDNRPIRWVVVSLLILLLIPLLAMLGMMMFGSGMMVQMSGGTLSGGVMGLCALWTVLVAAALVFLIVLLVRRGDGTTGPGIPSANMRSALPH